MNTVPNVFYNTTNARVTLQEIRRVELVFTFLHIDYMNILATRISHYVIEGGYKPDKEGRDNNMATSTDLRRSGLFLLEKVKQLDQ